MRAHFDAIRLIRARLASFLHTLRSTEYSELVLQKEDGKIIECSSKLLLKLLYVMHLSL